MLMQTVETPCVLIDEDIVEANIAAAQARFDALGVALRPHIKTHKLVRFAQRQIAAGAVGITCQKTSEALPFVDAGCDDVLITYNILGPAKLERLAGLARRARVTVVADNGAVVAGLSRAFAQATTPLRVLVECDTGLGRCGVQSPQDAAHLAGVIARAKGLTFAGLMTYPAPESHARVENFMAQAKQLCIETAGACELVSSGGTPSMMTFARGVVTEYRPGTYIYNDRSLLARGACVLEDCALTVAATIVSRPTPDRAIIDAGSKTLSSDLLGLAGYGMLRDYPEAVITGLSEEHGHIDLSACARRPELGEVVAVLPNHACVVSNLFDTVQLHRSGRLNERVRVDARGSVL
jgi:D-serine deaminase-like pyridoxal phosphate-dependent protein